MFMIFWSMKEEIFDNNRKLAFDFDPCDEEQMQLKPGDKVLVVSNMKPPSDFEKPEKAINLMCYLKFKKTG